MEILNLLPSVFSLIAPTLIFAACLYYVVSIVCLDSILLAVGAGIGLLMTGFFTYAPYYAQSRALSADSMTSYYAIGGVVSLLATIIFAVGLFILMDKVIKQHKTNCTQNKSY